MIAFSGGCHSGKTTLMNAVANKLREMGKNVIVFKENAHKFIKKGGIDELRANPSKYLGFQETVIHERIDFEKKWLDGRLNKSTDTTVVLMDRPITDSLAYMFMYINVDSLSDTDKQRYENLIFEIHKHLTRFWATSAFTIISLTPLKQSCPISETDFRPAKINSVKDSEHRVTNLLLDLYPKVVNIHKYSVHEEYSTEIDAIYIIKHFL